MLTARRIDRLEELASELKEVRPGLPILTIAADLADPSAPGRLVDETIGRFGGIDVLVNNAGLGLPTLFEDAEPEQIVRQLAVNLTAPLLLTRLSLPSLVARKGMIINIGSAITCVANSALGAYGATKAGLAYWNDALRRELAKKGVTVCLVEPGPIKTEFMDALTSLVPGGQASSPDSRQCGTLDECQRRGGCPPSRPVARSSPPAALDPETLRLDISGLGFPRAALPAAGRPAGDRHAAARWQTRSRRSENIATDLLLSLVSQRDDLGFLAAFFGAEPLDHEVVVVDDGRDRPQLVGLSGLRIA